MTAKHKLNSAVLHGVLVAAAGIGAVFGSWLVFLLAAGVLIVTSIHDGSLRK